MWQHGSRQAARRILAVMPLAGANVGWRDRVARLLPWRHVNDWLADTLCSVELR
jgi:hypothetical protein